MRCSAQWCHVQRPSRQKSQWLARRPFGTVLRRLQPESATPDLERELFGYDHAELGSRIATEWHLSESIAETIRYHHQPDAYFGSHREMVYVVNVANYFCSRLGWTSLGVHNTAPPPDRVYAGLELDEVALSVIWEELPQTLDRAQSLATG